MSFADELKNNFKQGNNLIKLIYINVAIFVIVNFISLIYFLFTKVSLDPLFGYFINFPSNIVAFVYRPWTIVTYMFMHADILHILFNLLWLYWFGQIFLQYLDQKKLLSVYILGGISGALMYALAYNALPAFNLERYGSSLVGASAAIMAVVFAISAIVPNYAINLLFFGPVKLKYIAIFTIILDVLSIQSGNAGGHIAHLGGALFGYYFAVRYKKGKDITKGFTRFLDGFFSLFKPRKKMKVEYKKPVDDFEYNRSKVNNQKEIDRILDKIAKGGYNSLTKDEKDFLFRSSK
jgi:membrane associated rhomboid family serine protease